MNLGKVIYSSGGNYKVLFENKTYFAKPLGYFRNENIKILVGDIVEFEINENKEGLEEINVITKLIDRRNEFIRPNISNVDNVIIVTSINEPKLNDYYLDKLITIFQSKDVEPILIFTKADVGVNEEQQSVIDQYNNANYKILVTNNTITNEQKELLHSWTRDKFSVLTGQTGVGKSTLLNLINPSFNIDTQEISEALGRGKHTTRHSEAFEVFENSYIIDTPGFSSLDIDDIDLELISHNFFDFERYAINCKYNNCLHIKEKECKIKERGYPERILNNYKKLIEEKKQNEQRK